MKKIEEFDTVKDLVEEILRTDKRARKDDRWLVYSVYRKITRIFIPFRDFEKLPSPETITRWRRYFQNTLDLYKDEEIAEKRAEAKEEVKKYFSNQEG